MTDAAAGSAGAGRTGAARRLGSARWALMFGNFVIGSGLMAAPGALNDIARSLQVSVPVAGPADQRRRGDGVLRRTVARRLGRRLRPAPPARAGPALVRRSATRCARYRLGLCRPAADPGRDHARRGRVHAAGGGGDRLHGGARASAAATSRSSSSAGRWPRCSACRSPRGSARRSAGARRSARSPRSASSPRSGSSPSMPDGVRPAALSLAAWRRAFSSPCADGDRRRHVPLRRRPVHAVLVLHALLPRRPGRLGRGLGPAARLVRRLRPGRQRRPHPPHRPHRRARRGHRHGGADRALARRLAARPRAARSASRSCSCRGGSAASPPTRRSRPGSASPRRRSPRRCSPSTRRRSISARPPARRAAAG